MSYVEIPNMVQKGLRDEKNAFLFDDLEEEVYIRCSTRVWWQGLEEQN